MMLSFEASGIWLCRRKDQKRLNYVIQSSFKWEQLLISFLKSLKEDINLFECYALVMFGCFLIQFWLHRYEFDYISLSLLNEYLWYDKLWGPSQRVVTLFYIKVSFEKHPSVHSIFVKLDFSFHITYLKLCFDNWIISVIFLIWKFLNIIIPYLLKLDLYYVQGL